MTATMGVQHSKGATTRQSTRKSGSEDKASKCGTSAAFRAIDARNVSKLRKALSSGAALGTVRRVANAATETTSQPRSMSLLEYAVDKNFVAGIDVMLKMKPMSELQQDSDSVTAAFMRSCDSGYLRLGIFNLFVDAAIDGRIKLDLEAIYRQLVDHYTYRKPYDLARRPCFDIVRLNDGTCRITPLGLAVIHDDADALESFVTRGADVNSYDRDGNTALLRAGYSLKRACFQRHIERYIIIESIQTDTLLCNSRLLLLGADPNKRSWKRASSQMSSMSPLISVCVAYGQNSRSRTSLIAALLACGAEPSRDRIWFAGPPVVSSGPGTNTQQPHCVLRRLDDEARRVLAELCVRPRSLQTLSAAVVRRCLASAEANGVAKNTDSLPIPSTLKAVIKLQIKEM